MLFFESFLGHYISQVIFYSLVTTIVVGSLLAIWHIREPLLQIEFRFLILLLPILYPLLYYLIYPTRNSPHFRQQVALIDLNSWLGLDLGGNIALWHLFVAMLAVTIGVVLAKEAVPGIKHYLGNSSSFSVITKGQFPKLDEVLANIPGLKVIPAPRILLSPEDVPTAYSLSGKRLVISASMINLLDSDELQAVIEHEIAHLSRQLIWINRALLTLRFLMFYNPIAFFVFYQINNDTEKLCDDIAIRSSGKRLSLTSGLLKIFRHSAAIPLQESTGKIRPEPRVAALKNVACRNIVKERAERIVRNDEANRIPYRNFRLTVTLVMLTGPLFFVT
ncbi:M56 family metallopeptidase [Chloroflexota bacterium]